MLQLLNENGVRGMSKNGAQVLEEALALPPDERAEVADRLLSSLDKQHQRKIDQLWAEEAEDRINAYERDEIRAVSVP
jgi:putative addiction module component (TIGR02574 family)